MNSALRRRLALIETRLPPIEPGPSAVDRLIEFYSIMIRCNQRIETKGTLLPVQTAQLRKWRAKWRAAKRANPVDLAPQAEEMLKAWRLRLVPIIERLQKGSSPDTETPKS